MDPPPEWRLQSIHRETVCRPASDYCDLNPEVVLVPKHNNDYISPTQYWQNKYIRIYLHIGTVYFYARRCEPKVAQSIVVPPPPNKNKKHRRLEATRSAFEGR